MAGKEGYRWLRGGWQPTPRQCEVLDLLVEGRTNAEIASGLGISFAGAKWHIEELLAATGCENRQALAAWWRTQREKKQRGIIPVLALRGLTVAAGAVALLGLLGFLLPGSGAPHTPDHPNPQAAADFDQPSPTPVHTATPDPGEAPPCNTVLPGDYRVVSPQELRAQGLVEFGRIIQPRTCPLQVANRADLAFLWLADGGEINLSESVLHIVSSFGPYYRGSNYPPSDLGFYYQGEQFRASMQVQDEGLPVFVTTSAPNIAVVPGRDTIEFIRTGSDGAYASVSLEGEESGRHRVAFSSDGTLFFDPRPLPDGLATNWTTGEAIDVTGMTDLGQITFEPGGWPDTPSNSCDETTDLCHALLPAPSGPISLPVGGVLSCVPVASAGTEREAYEIDTGDYVLQLSPFGGSGIAWDGDCETVSAWRDSVSHRIEAGAEFYAWTYTSISVFSSDGSPISAVIARDRHLYIGEVALSAGCPCRIGN